MAKGDRTSVKGGHREGSMGDLLLIGIIENPQLEWKLSRPKIIDRVRGKIGSARRDLLKLFRIHQKRFRQ